MRSAEGCQRISDISTSLILVQFFQTVEFECGRGLAPDGGVSASTCGTDPLPSGGSRIVAPPLPHWIFCVLSIGPANHHRCSMPRRALGHRPRCTKTIPAHPVAAGGRTPATAASPPLKHFSPPAGGPP